MIKTIIIDDEPLARNIVAEYLRDYVEVEVVQHCGDGFEGIKAIAHHHPDLIFLDVQMPKINGFEMLELLDEPPSVIFTTAFDEFAIKAFETQAVDYLLKPFSRERFDKAMKKWLQQRHAPSASNLLPEIRQAEEGNRVVVKEGGNIRIIPIIDVVYLEAYDDYVKLYTAKEMFLKKKTMNFYEKTLDPKQFARVHRSFIVKISQITRIEPVEKDSHIAILKTGAKIPLSRNGYSRLKTILDL